MKLLDQVFKLCQPSEWASHIDVAMPNFWADATSDITSDEIEFINWNSGFLMVAKYAAEDDDEPFVTYREATAPTSLRITFREGTTYASKKVYGPEYKSRTLRHTCGCCITIFYTEAK